MGQTSDCYAVVGVVDDRQHAISTDSNAALVFGPHELLAAGRPGVLCQVVDGGFDSLTEVRRKILKIARGGRTQKDGVGHQRVEIACFRR
jgi:hypothetical protein